MRTFSNRSLLFAGWTALAFSVGVTPAERFECLVEPYADVNIASEIEGVLGQVFVDRGDTVQKGQALAKLVSDVEEAHLELVKARAAFAARRAERNVELYLKQMISPHEKDELETDAQLLRLELLEAETLLSRRTIRSPIDGVVVEQIFSPGEFVNELPMLRLAQIDPVRIETAVPAEYFGQVKVGMTGLVEWESSTIGVQSAKVTVVDPVVDPASGTIGIRFELPNPDHGLPVGTKCWVQLPVEKAD